MWGESDLELEQFFSLKKRRDNWKQDATSHDIIRKKEVEMMKMVLKW